MRTLQPLLAAWVIALVTLGCTDLKRFAYEGVDRDDWQRPDFVIESLSLSPGAFVADLGSGGGYFTFRLADAVGPEGRVYAVDVDAAMNADLAERAAERGYEQVEVILADPDDPKIPGDGVDLLFTCNTYHHIEDRESYFRRARRHLRPDARVAIIDLKEEGIFQWLFPHSTSADTIRSEMEAAGYVFHKEIDLPRQHFLVFGLPPDEDAGFVADAPGP